MAQPGYPHRIPSSLVAERLREATTMNHHRFWPDKVSLLDTKSVDWGRVIGPRQITDVYLLALAVAYGGRFITFDARIAPEMVPGGKKSFCLI